MSTIQNLKNFIRHGKQARDAKSPPDQPTVTNVHAQHQRHNQQPQNIQQQHQHYALSDPNVFEHKPLQAEAQRQGDFSAAVIDNRNVAAKAGAAAADAVDQQHKSAQAKAAIAAAEKRGDKVDPDVLERIVAEEREAKGKLPRYPGLERYQLIEKMGDGAFSNVYRAKDTKGVFNEVAVKVVRKFEMNSTQVCNPALPIRSVSHFAFLLSLLVLLVCYHLHNRVSAIDDAVICLLHRSVRSRMYKTTKNQHNYGRATNICIQT